MPVPDHLRIKTQIQNIARKLGPSLSSFIWHQVSDSPASQLWPDWPSGRSSWASGQSHESLYPFHPLPFPFRPMKDSSFYRSQLKRQSFPSQIACSALQPRVLLIHGLCFQVPPHPLVYTFGFFFFNMVCWIYVYVPMEIRSLFAYGACMKPSIWDVLSK